MKTRRFISSAITILLLAHAAAVFSAIPEKEFPLWKDAAPIARGEDPVKDVPTLTPYLPAPDTRTGAAMVICPGGGYGGLAGHEGKDYALWMNKQGITAFVLKYRLGSSGYRHPAMLMDVQRAIRYVRANAADWQIDPERIGVMGSSAGGHLASTAATHFDNGNPDATDAIDKAGCRPNLAILCYPVISMGPNTHGGSRNNLLGPNPDPALVTFLSSELQVSNTTPPCFLWHTFEDGAVKLEGVLDFADALRKNHIPFELHVYEKGGHGMGLGIRPFKPEESQKLHPWADEMGRWLKEHKFAQ